MYYTQEQIDRANQADLVSFLQSQGEQLTRAGNEYRWKRHDSLTVRGNKWYRHSQSKGGGPVDFVMEFFGKSFTEAVELLTGEKGAAPPPDRPCHASLSDFRLPPPNNDNRIARNYLTAARRIDEDVTGFFFARGDIYEDAAHHNAVFVGRDEDGIPRYAHSKGTAGNFRLDVKGSDKAFNFCYRGEGDRLFAFEAPVDLLSFLCLFKKEWQKQSYLSLGGVGEKALLRFLSDRPNIKTVYLCLDSDQAGNDACSRLAELVPEGLTVHRLVPLFKDWNEVLKAKNGAAALPAVPHKRKEEYLHQIDGLKYLRCRPDKLTSQIYATFKNGQYRYLAEYALAGSAFFMPKTEQINSECKAFVWLQNKLKGSYKPYTDKGRKALKLRNLQECMQEVLRDLKQTARTREQSVQTAKLLYSLADSALRLNVENTLSELTQEQSESEYIVSEPEQCMEFG